MTPLPRVRVFAALMLVMFCAGGVGLRASVLPLREAAGGSVLIGCSAGSRDIADPETAAMIVREFDCFTADNEFMPKFMVDDEGRYTWEIPDRLANFARDHDMPFYGHMLVWQHETRAWLFEDKDGKPLPREQALKNLRDYITTVVHHFRGRVKAWAVVNEALSDEGDTYLRDTPARRAIGDDFIARAFEYAHAADPTVPLYYNDYNIELPYKREKTLRLLRELRAEGLRVDAVGIQGHWLLGGPAPEVISDAIREFHEAGFEVMITELDVDVLPRTTSGADLQSVDEGPNPYPNGLPDEVQQQLAQRYGEIFEAILRPPGVSMITFWGPHDGRSWLNDFPVRRRTNYPLLFDRELRPKPAHAVVSEILAKHRASALER